MLPVNVADDDAANGRDQVQLARQARRYRCPLRPRIHENRFIRLAIESNPHEASAVSQ